MKRMDRKVSAIGRAVLGLVLALLAGGLAAAGDEAAPVDFTLPKLDGGLASLADYRGQWVVLNYWATWCAPCRKEIPELSRLHTDRPDVTVLGLAYEDLEPAAFDAFLAEFTVSYPILLVDVYAPPAPFGAPKVLPTTILLDASGRSVKTFLGPVTRGAIENVIGRAADSVSSGTRP